MNIDESKKAFIKNTDKLTIILVENPITREKNFLITNECENLLPYHQAFTAKKILFDGIEFLAE